jgi:hypothetical protein
VKYPELGQWVRKLARTLDAKFHQEHDCGVRRSDSAAERRADI